MESIAVIRYFNLGCAIICAWNYISYPNFFIVAIGALNLAVFIFGKQLLEIFNK